VTGYAVRNDHFRFVYWCDDRKPDQPLALELYDHGKDPDENENVAAKPDHAQKIAALRKQLEVILPDKLTP
jgi:arylsulfatase A-like enzyme